MAFGADSAYRGISALLLLRAVTAAGLLEVLHALGVGRAADDLVADTVEVLHPAAADEHDRVLLEVVAHARDVRRDLDAARQAHAGDLAEGGVRLLRGGGVDPRADATALRGSLQGRRLVLGHLVLAALADQLVNGGHLGGSLSCHLSVQGTLPGTGCCGDAMCLWVRGTRVGARNGLVVPDTRIEATPRPNRGQNGGSAHPPRSGRHLLHARWGGRRRERQHLA